jgi:hypothetical protein
MNPPAKANFVVLAFIIISMCCFIGPAGAEQNEEIRTIGTSPVVGKNIARAKKAALDNALDNALIQAVLKKTNLDQVSRNLQVLNEQVFRVGRGFIRDYKVEAETSADDQFTVVVRVTLAEQALEEALNNAGLKKQIAAEKILLVFYEGPDWVKPIVSDALNAALAPSGFLISFAQPESADLSTLGAETWADIGSQKKADLVLWVSCSAGCALEQTEQVPCQAAATLKLVNVRTKTLTASDTLRNEDVFPSREQGRKKSALDLGDQLGRFLNERLKTSVQKEAASVSLIKVFLLGVTRYGQYEQISKTIKEKIPGAVDVFLDSAAGVQFVVGVRFRGTPMELETQLLNHPFAEFQLVPLGQTEGSVTLEVRPKGEARPQPGVYPPAGSM